MKYILLILFVLTMAPADTSTKKTYYPDGKIKTAVTYKDGKKNGSSHFYYPDGATLKYSRNYVYGKLHGLQQEYSPDAILISEESYNHGRLDGRSRRYDKNGLLQSEKNYRNGMLEGVSKEFYPNGLVKMEIRWRRGNIVEGYLYGEDGSRRSLTAEELKIFASDKQ